MEPDRAARGAAEDGEELPLAGAGVERGPQLVERELGPLEVLLEERVVGLGERLDEVLAGRGDGVGVGGAWLDGPGRARELAAL